MPAQKVSVAPPLRDSAMTLTEWLVMGVNIRLSLSSRSRLNSQGGRGRELSGRGPTAGVNIRYNYYLHRTCGRRTYYDEIHQCQTYQNQPLAPARFPFGFRGSRLDN